MSPSRNINVRCSTAMWIAIIIQFVGALGLAATLIWAVATYKANTEARIASDEARMVSIETKLSELAAYVYAHREHQ